MTIHIKIIWIGVCQSFAWKSSDRHSLIRATNCPTCSFMLFIYYWQALDYSSVPCVKLVNLSLFCVETFMKSCIWVSRLVVLLRRFSIFFSSNFNHLSPPLRWIGWIGYRGFNLVVPRIGGIWILICTHIRTWELIISWTVCFQWNSILFSLSLKRLQ